ncbi:MAG: hypothetical protein K9N06_10840 [Candidatus Cloacimonetes bacterium]|nr:hypothetical protein [Candidatus Cloacimonadota bacterium]
MSKLFRKAVVLLILYFITIPILADELLIRIENYDRDILTWMESHQKSERIIYAREYLDILADQETIDFFDSKHLQYTVLKTREEIVRDLENYRNYDDILGELQTYAADFADITSLFSLGPSTCSIYYSEGNENYADYQHEIWCLKVSDNPEIEEDEPNIYFSATIHANETIGTEVVMTFMQEFFAGYGTDPEIAEYVANNQIWFIPLINPDGQKIVVEELSLSHRKNMRDNNGNGMPDYSTTDGVDMNRNFGYVWGPNGTSSNPSSNLYHGPEAWSEIEVQHLRDLIQGRKFWGGITYHSQGEWVLYPLGHLPGACSYDHEIMGDLAIDMALTIPRLSGSGYYTPAQAVNFGYTCQGTMGDWSYAEERVFGYTIELANTYIPENPYQVCQDNQQAIRIMLNRFNNRLLTGHVTDPWGTPLVAEIHVVQVDEQTEMSDVEPYRSGAHFGRYWRPLLTGNYDVEYILEGYDTETVENIAVNENGITEVNVTLYPIWWGEHFKGDVDDNGSIDAFDSSVLMRYLVGWDPAPYAPLPWEDWRLIIADASNDGRLDSYDCALILQYVVGIIPEF